MRYATRLLFFLLIVCHPGCTHRVPAGVASSSASRPVERLRTRLDQIFSDPLLSHAQLGAEVFSLDRSEMLYEKNAQRLFIPASCNKLVTGAVALIRLGPKYRFRTEVKPFGQIENGTLNGNLVISGNGDPSNSLQFTDEPFATFMMWAAELKEKNIHRIIGDIVGDDTAFGGPRLGLGWEWNDLSQAYAAPVGALQFYSNALEIQITPGSEKGDTALIRTSPLQNYIKINNQIVTGPEGSPPDIRIQKSDIDETIDAFGTIPLGTTLWRNVAVRNPTLYYLSSLNYVLSKEGIDTKACRFRTGKVDQELPALSWSLSSDSAELSWLIIPILTDSLNLPAETLVRSLGLELRHEGTFNKGKEVVEESLDQMGIKTGTYSFADGSGLSRLNLQSADALVRLLWFMYRDRNFRYFYDALPIAGVDGTLSERMKGTKAENNVHAKTGSMTGVSSISGYVKTGNGEMLAFSVAVNNFIGSKEPVESLQDKIIELLADFSRK
jgi:D-alanyl-D-alanine carboxypeptidase/D-alanyl-D-alanine-endopeptidase (penicillin-binding protein 4)